MHEYIHKHNEMIHATHGHRHNHANIATITSSPTTTGTHTTTRTTATATVGTKKATADKLMRARNKHLPDEMEREKLMTFLADPWVNLLLYQKG